MFNSPEYIVSTVGYTQEQLDAAVEAAIEATKEKAIIVCEQAFDAPEETMWNAAIEYVRKRLEKI